jgi:hypothetical protein
VAKILPKRPLADDSIATMSAPVVGETIEKARRQAIFLKKRTKSFYLSWAELCSQLLTGCREP